MEIMQLVDDKIKELNGLYVRMDKTKERLENPYELKDYDGKTISKAISVTLNMPRWQANVMADKLLKLQWQTVVQSSSKLPKTKISAIEQFSDDVWSQIDEFLSEQRGLTGGLDTWNAKKVVTRGPIGARWWLYYDKDDNLIIDCQPLDMRWCPFELNEWYCNITYRDAESLKLEYQDQEGFSVGGLGGNDLEVRDCWNGDKEEIYVAKKKIGEKPNPFKVAPFVVVMTSAGFQFRDKGYLEHESESFDWLDRDLYDEANRSASIAQSLAMDSLLGGFEQERANPSDPAVKPPAPDESINVGIGETHHRIERGDLNNAYMKASQEITQAISRGGVTDTEAGNNEQGRTALWVTTQNALLVEKLKPWQDSLADFRQKSMRMIIDQYIKLGKIKKSKEIDFGIRGMKHRYSAEQLGDPSTYRITYVPMLNSQEQNIANVAIANAQRGLLPQRFILQDTLQVQDPDGMIRELEMEKAKQADPTIGMLDMALSYAEEAQELTGIDADIKNEMSRILTENVVVMRRQRRMAMMPQPTPKEEAKPNMQGLMALTGDRGGVSKVTATTEAK
ncbi:MAG: hypothetical protein WC639_04675 [Patescibacteria group bacterium]|jgi:hypothetical protein